MTGGPGVSVETFVEQLSTEVTPSDEKKGQ